MERFGREMTRGKSRFGLANLFSFLLILIYKRDQKVPLTVKFEDCNNHNSVFQVRTRTYNSREEKLLRTLGIHLFVMCNIQYLPTSSHHMRKFFVR
jgi:hypothetical protein